MSACFTMVYERQEHGDTLPRLPFRSDWRDWTFEVCSMQIAYLQCFCAWIRAINSSPIYGVIIVNISIRL